MMLRRHHALLILGFMVALLPLCSSAPGHHVRLRASKNSTHVYTPGNYTIEVPSGNLTATAVSEDRPTTAMRNRTATVVLEEIHTTVNRNRTATAALEASPTPANGNRTLAAVHKKVLTATDPTPSLSSTYHTPATSKILCNNSGPHLYQDASNYYYNHIDIVFADHSYTAGSVDDFCVAYICLNANKVLVYGEGWASDVGSVCNGLHDINMGLNVTTGENAVAYFGCDQSSCIKEFDAQVAAYLAKNVDDLFTPTLTFKDVFECSTCSNSTESSSSTTTSVPSTSTKTRATPKSTTSTAEVEATSTPESDTTSPDGHEVLKDQSTGKPESTTKNAATMNFNGMVFMMMAMIAAGYLTEAGF